MPECLCPYCGVDMNALMDSGKTQGREPQPGQPALCVECLEVSIIADDMTLRAPLLEEIRDEWIEPIQMARKVLKEKRDERERKAHEEEGKRN
tara:strand:+ start:1036 stop:1314 length:279 start_codon:yes stop_codon:yes gene_type:complete